MNKGDIVLIPFSFTDLSGSKNRPAIILVDAEYDVTVCFLTSHTNWQASYDLLVKPSYKNGLKRESLIRLSKRVTIDKNLILGKPGELEEKYVKGTSKNFKFKARENFKPQHT